MAQLVNYELVQHDLESAIDLITDLTIPLYQYM